MEWSDIKAVLQTYPHGHRARDFATRDLAAPVVRANDQMWLNKQDELWELDVDFIMELTIAIQEFVCSGREGRRA